MTPAKLAGAVSSAQHPVWRGICYVVLVAV